MESNPRRRNSTTGHCSLRRGKKFQVLKVRLRMERIRGLSGKEKVIYGLVLVFCKFWVEDLVSVIVMKDKLLLNLFLYNKYILASFPSSSGLCSNKANLC